MKKLTSVSVGFHTILLLAVCTSLMNVQLGVNAQQASQNNFSGSVHNASKISESQIPAKSTGYFQGKSIRIFTVLNMYSVTQWAPIDNYTASGWEIKAIVPSSLFQSGRTFLWIILEKTE